MNANHYTALIKLGSEALPVLVAMDAFSCISLKIDTPLRQIRFEIVFRGRSFAPIRPREH